MPGYDVVGVELGRTGSERFISSHDYLQCRKITFGLTADHRLLTSFFGFNKKLSEPNSRKEDKYFNKQTNFR